MRAQREQQWNPILVALVAVATPSLLALLTLGPGWASLSVTLAAGLAGVWLHAWLHRRRADEVIVELSALAAEEGGVAPEPGASLDEWAAWLARRRSRPAAPASGDGPEERCAALRAATRALLDRSATLLPRQREDLQEIAISVSAIYAAVKQVSAALSALLMRTEDSSTATLEMTASSEEVNANMTQLARDVEEATTAVEQMSVSIASVARAVEELSNTFEETSTSVNEIDLSVEQVKQFANDSATLSGAVKRAAEAGVESIDELSAGMASASETSVEAVEVIRALDVQIREIGRVLRVIHDVADQTNLLALNAAIIAAQAGEHGRGFAVVADEIKALAERTAYSTLEIRDIVEQIQQGSSAAIRAVERGVERVSSGVRLSVRTSESLSEILASSEQAHAMAREIAQITLEQSSAVRRVATAVGEVAVRVVEISRATGEQERVSVHLREQTGDMRDISVSVARSTQEQTQGSRIIARAMTAIKSQVEQAGAGLRGQEAAVAEVLSTAERIAGVQLALGEALDELRGDVGEDD